MTKQKEPLTVALLDAFDSLSHAVNDIQTASLDNVGHRMEILRQTHRLFRTQFNRYFLMESVQRGAARNE